MNKEFEHRNCGSYRARFCGIQPAEDLIRQFYVFQILFKLINEDGGIQRDPAVTCQEFRERLILGYQDPRSLARCPRGEGLARPRIAFA
jgi:hypothetical protein